MNNLIKIGDMYYSDIQISGRRIRRALSVNKREAGHMVADMKAMWRSGRWGEMPRRVSWTYFKTRIYESLEAEGMVEGTIYQYKIAFRRLEAALPISYLNDVTPERLDLARTRWDIATWAKESHVRFIKAAMRRAENWKLIGLQNWRVVKRLRPQHRKLYYDIDQLGSVIEKSPEPYSIAMRLMGRAGLRSGEVLHLTWGDCDFGAGIIRIRKKAGWQPKMKKERDVPMSDDVMAHLKSFCKGRYEPHDLILGGIRPMKHNKFWYHIKKHLRAVGLTGYPHAFRHTLASHLSQAGEDLKRVGDIMGHSDLATTAIYAHSNSDSMKKSIQKLPEICTGLVRGSTARGGKPKPANGVPLLSTKPVSTDSRG